MIQELDFSVSLLKEYSVCCGEHHQQSLSSTIRFNTFQFIFVCLIFSFCPNYNKTLYPPTLSSLKNIKSLFYQRLWNKWLTGSRSIHSSLNFPPPPSFPPIFLGFWQTYAHSTCCYHFHFWCLLSCYNSLLPSVIPIFYFLYPINISVLLICHLLSNAITDFLLNKQTKCYIFSRLNTVWNALWLLGERSLRAGTCSNVWSECAHRARYQGLITLSWALTLLSQSQNIKMSSCSVENTNLPVSNQRHLNISDVLPKTTPQHGTGVCARECAFGVCVFGLACGRLCVTTRNKQASR